MTLGDMKQKVFRLIEEINENNIDLTDDPDFKNKINDVIDQIQHELSRIKKIHAMETMSVVEGEEFELNELDNFYQLNKITGVLFNNFGNIIEFEETGEVKIYYYKYPKKITRKSQDNVKLELTEDALEIMPYGVAADLLMSDASNQYWEIYRQRNLELKQGLDPRYNENYCYIDGGIDF